MTRLFWMVLFATVVVHAAMALWTLPAITREAGGLAPFDLRPLGYDADAARRFLSALTERGRALYLGPQQGLDLLYPTLLAATLCLALARLTAGMARVLRVLLLALPIAGAVFDHLENLRVRWLLTIDPETVTAEMVDAASRATVAKSALSTLSFSAILVLLAWRMVRRLRRERSG